MRNRIKNIERPHHPQSDACVPNLGFDSELTNSIAKQTCQSPKKDVLIALESDSTLNHDVIKRFKYCEGKPVFRVSDVDNSHQGLRARGYCIVCKKRTNWYCIQCRNWACNNRSEGTIKHVVDANEDKNGHRITAVKSCFIHCHPNYL